MIELKQYKDWSFKFHNDHARKPIVMQMELTYRCPIHCVHCYTDCYNNSEWAKTELSTREVKKIIDKLYDANCLWFTFTGGDPMVRSDFLELYDYVKDKGFIFSIMTSLIALTDEILKMMIEKPPFSIEMTLNSVTEETYEKISQVKGSFSKVMKNIDGVLNAGLPLKVKTLVSKNNLYEIEKIADFLEAKGFTFSPSSLIFARLNGDTTPCQYRLDADEIIKTNPPEDECTGDVENIKEAEEADASNIETNPLPNRFFRCAIGSWQWHIDPRGRLNICSCVREPSYDILAGDLREGVKVLANYVEKTKFVKDSECKFCKIWHLCQSCPGKAKLEVNDAEKPVAYFCTLAKKEAKNAKKQWPQKIAY